MSQANDEQLMAKVRSGDHGAFEAVVHRHIDGLYNYALRLSGSSDDAQDLVQETLMTSWQKASRFNPKKSRLTTWLHRVLYNKFIDGTRKRKINLDDSIDIDSLSGSPNNSPQTAHHADQVRLLQLIGKLPEQQRSAIVLAHLQGFSNKEVAHILGVGLRAAESLLARARNALRAAHQQQSSREP